MASGSSARCLAVHLLRRASPFMGHPAVASLPATLNKQQRSIQSRLFSADGTVVTHTEAAARQGTNGTGAKAGTGMKDASPHLELCGDIEGEMSLFMRLKDPPVSVTAGARFCRSRWDQQQQCCYSIL